ncbi:MAG TPA: acyltransferase family protein, partial [Pseudonocardiaceae bacterium]
AVYLLATAATPLMRAVAGRWGLAVPVVLGLGAFGVDALRFHGLPLVGYANELFVWLAIQQLGIGYASGQLDRLSRRGAAALGIAGFGATILLVLFGPYPASMVGVPGQAVSNMAPATSCLLTLGVGQIGVLLALRERLVRWTGSGRLLPVLGQKCMTLYLWHMPAMVLVAGIAVLGFGYATPAPGSPGWLAVTPLWLAALAVVLIMLVRVFGRFERIRPVGRAPSARCLLVAVVLVYVGLVGIVVYGFVEPLRTLPWVVAVLVGLGLTWPGVGSRTATRLLGTLIDAIFGGPRRP